MPSKTPPDRAPAEPSDTARQHHAAPVLPHDRIVVVDIVRGFALFGVLLLNLLSFSGPTLSFEAWAGSETWWDRLVELLLLVGGEAAFYSTFSFLFGLGVALQIQRADSRGDPFTMRHLSRMAVLLVFGILHIVLIWDGDILVQYAIAGCFLLFFARRTPATMLVWAAALGVVVAAMMLGVGLLSLLGSPAATPASEIAAEVELHGSGTFLELARSRLAELGYVLVEALLGSLWFVPIFLTGMWSVSSGKVSDWRNQRPFVLKVLKVSLPIAIVTKAAYGIMIVSQSVRLLDSLAPLLSAFVAGPAMGASFICLLLLALQGRQEPGVWRHLAPVGRMALTNYLLQSVVATAVFYGFGLGLYGRIGIAAAVGLGVAFFGAQVVVSGVWLRCFRFGPMEWLWRALTYRRSPSRIQVLQKD